MRAMDYDMATITTGVEANLICGETHILGYTIHTKNTVIKFTPIDINHHSVLRKKAFIHRFARKFHVIFDEDSIIGRQTFAWLLHRLTEGRRGLTQAGLDTDYGHLYTTQSALRFIGGVPLFTTYGNIHQIPAVGEKCLFDNVPGELGTSDAERRIDSRIVLHPETESGTFGVSVVMYQTIRPHRSHLQGHNPVFS
jgi:hypothetical protein